MELVVSVGKKWRPPVRRGRGMTSCLRKTEAPPSLINKGYDCPLLIGIRLSLINKGQSYPY